MNPLRLPMIFLADLEGKVKLRIPRLRVTDASHVPPLISLPICGTSIVDNCLTSSNSSLYRSLSMHGPIRPVGFSSLAMHHASVWPSITLSAAPNKGFP